MSSYAINDYLNWGQGVEIPQAHQVSKISKPSETFVFIEAADAGGAVFSIPIDPSGQAMGWEAKPGYWHDGTSIAFVDGHAEYFKYLDPRTRDLWKQGSNYLAQPDNQDAIRIAAMEHPQ